MIRVITIAALFTALVSVEDAALDGRPCTFADVDFDQSTDIISITQVS